MPVPEGKEIYSPNPINLDPGVNSDEEEDIDNIFQVSNKSFGTLHPSPRHPHPLRPHNKESVVHFYLLLV